MDGVIFKAFIENKGLNKTKLAKELDMSKQNLYQLFESKEFSESTISTIEKRFRMKWEKIKASVNIDELKDQVNEQEIPYIVRRRNKKNESQRRIPFYDASAIAGITETEMTPIHAPSGTIDVGDLLHDSQAAIRIYGNSMLPNYPPGCVVGLSRCQSLFIEPGEVYVIETSDRRILKRLFYSDDEPDSDSFICYSDNIMKFDGGARHGKPAYPPFSLLKKEIMNLFLVTGVIKRNANSIIINRKP